jgi:hypothetical protein
MASGNFHLECRAVGSSLHHNPDCQMAWRALTGESALCLRVNEQNGIFLSRPESACRDPLDTLFANAALLVPAGDIDREPFMLRMVRR